VIEDKKSFPDRAIDDVRLFVRLRDDDNAVLEAETLAEAQREAFPASCRFHNARGGDCGAFGIGPRTCRSLLRHPDESETQ
jgi:hypothetical protein